MSEERYAEYTVQHYGNVADLYRETMKDFGDAIIDRLIHMEEYRKKEAEYWASPEGQAIREERRLLLEKRDRFKKKWQPLHDWLSKNGCECDHDDCY